MLVEIYDDAGNVLGLYENDLVSANVAVRKVDGVESITSSRLSELVANSYLNSGYLYYINDVPDWKVYLYAASVNEIFLTGFGIHEVSGVKAEIAYDLVNNLVIRAYDYSGGNWVAGATNVSNFPWGNSIFSDNIIKGNALLSIDPAPLALFTGFRNNIIESGTITIDASCQILAFNSNTFIYSTVDFLNVDCTNFEGNNFSNADSTFKNFTLTSLSNNVFKDLTYFYLDTVTVGNFSRNVFEDCSIDNGSPIIASSFTDNRIVNSSINFIDGNLTDISKNEITDSTINITSTAGTANFSANAINESTFDLTNDSGLFTCELFGVIGNLGTTLDTGINYVNCTYKANDYSSFYATYDFSSATYYNAGASELLVQAQHKNIIGIFLVTNNVSGDKIIDISNTPTKHKFQVKIGSGGNELHVDTTGNIIILNNLKITVPIKLDSIYALQEYVEFDYRPTPVGTDNGSGNITVVDTVLYGTLSIPQYQGQLTLTTTGTSGPATLVSNTLNIPQYAGGGGGVSASTAIAYSIALG